MFLLLLNDAVTFVSLAEKKLIFTKVINANI